jgi:transposase-like protein
MSQAPTPSGAVPVSPEVVVKPQRRIYTAEYKRRILAQADAATEKGDMARLLRREGIYSSTLPSWRRERKSAREKAFSQKRGPEPKSHPLARENEELRRQNQRLAEERRKAEIVIEIQKSGNVVWQAAAADARTRELLMAAVQDLSQMVQIKRACQELSVSRASYYRRCKRSQCPPDVDRTRSSARRLRQEEKAAVLACLHEERFQDCSIRTSLRLLAR